MSLKRNEKTGRKIVSRQIKQEQTALLSAYKKSLTNINNQIGKSTVFGLTPVGKLTRTKQMKALAKNVENEIAKLQQQEARIIGGVTEEAYKHSYYRGAQALETEVGGDLGFGMLNPKAVEAVVANKMSLVKWPDVSKTNAALMTKRVKGLIEQGVIQGQSYDKVARQIKQQMGIGAKKSLRIIRTEAGRAQNEGTIKTYDEAESEGLSIIRVWLASLDFKTRDTHASMDQQKADENSLFHSPSGAVTRGPHLFGIPAEDINCRCAITAEIPEMPAEVRVARDKAGKSVDIKNVDYDEWASTKGIRHHEKTRVICTSTCRPLGFGKEMPTRKQYLKRHSGEKSDMGLKYDYYKLRGSLGQKLTEAQTSYLSKYAHRYEGTSLKVVGKIKTKPLKVSKPKVKPEIPKAVPKGILDIEGVVEEYQSMIVKQVEILSKKFPKAGKTLKKVTMMNARAYQSMAGNSLATIGEVGRNGRSIVLDGATWGKKSKRNVSKIMKRNNKAKMVVGKNAEDAFVHEFGHVVQSSLPAKGFDRIFDFAWGIEEGPTMVGGKNFKAIGKQIGKYAQTNAKEAFAEAFCQYRMGKASPVAKKILRLGGLKI